MTIKRRLGVSNILMLIVPVILVALVSIGVLAAFIGIYRGAFKQIVGGEGITFVKNAVDDFTFDYANTMGKRQDKALRNLQAVLGYAGYHMSLECADTQIFSDLTDEDIRKLATVEWEGVRGTGSVMLVSEDLSMIQSNFWVNGLPAKLVALDAVLEVGNIKIQKQAEIFIGSYLWIVIILAIVVIALTNGVLSSRVAKSLLLPLERLSRGAKQIQQGNLECEMRYDGIDEFRQVFDDFDDMRIRLRDSVASRFEAERKRREFIAGISHDIRTPLTAIKGYVEGLRDGIANTPEKQKKYLDTIYRKTCDMDALADRLFLISKLETGQFPFRFVVIDLVSWLGGKLIGIKDEFSSRGLNIIYSNLCESEAVVQLDPDQISWVIINLLENSLKYKNKDSVNVTITLTRVEDEATITVADDGPGVLEAEINKLFDLFYRSDPSRTRPENGSGLGLAIAKQIVEAHGGVITAWNNGGLVVSIKLRLALKVGENT